MDLINATKMKAGYTLAVQPDGREMLVVVVKGTFLLPQRGRPASLAGDQVELVESDVFAGEPGYSAPVYEMDFAPRKPRCDVLLNGSAYAPGGKPVERLTVSLRVGSVKKSFDVVGPRTWHAQLLGVIPGRPQSFTRLPLSYACAFGGIDRSHPDPARHRWYPSNHAGVGYRADAAAKALDGEPLPTTEESGRPVTQPHGNYRPMAFGPVGRAWQPRAKWAGTYDQRWVDHVFPYLPQDFDDRYYQSAPDDQQTDYLHGGEEVELVNLTPEGRAAFKLPVIDVPIRYYLRHGQQQVAGGTLDTVVLEPDLGRFCLCWRSQLPLRRNLFEVEQVLVGERSPAWHRARRFGKTYCGSLRELAAWTKAGKVD
jgi:hypothetical protein